MGDKGGGWEISKKIKTLTPDTYHSWQESILNLVYSIGEDINYILSISSLAVNFSAMTPDKRRAQIAAEERALAQQGIAFPTTSEFHVSKSSSSMKSESDGKEKQTVKSESSSNQSNNQIDLTWKTPSENVRRRLWGVIWSTLGETYKDIARAIPKDKRQGRTDTTRIFPKIDRTYKLHRVDIACVHACVRAMRASE